MVQTAPANPGKNGWSGDADPFTILGDSAWANYSVSVLARVPPLPLPPLAASDGAPAALQPCSPTSPAQRWAWDAPAPGYLSNTPPSAPQQCLNVYGCQSKLVYWSCVTTGGTCCGASCYQGLAWSLDRAAGGALTSALPGALCATAAPPFSNASALTLAPCVGAQGQDWAYSSATGQVELRGTGLCLAQPPPPPPPTPYTQLCGRLSSFNGFAPGAAKAGYCLVLWAQPAGAWALVGYGDTLAQGALAAPPLAGSDVQLELQFLGAEVSAGIGGVAVARVAVGGVKPGRVALGSSFWAASFANFSVAPAA